MSNDDLPLLVSVDFSFSSSPYPWEAEEEYVQEITGIIKEAQTDTAERACGTIKLLKIQSVAAFNSGISLYEVCDAHSDWLGSMHGVFFDSDSSYDTKPDFDIEPTFDDILVLWEFEIEQAARDAGFLGVAFETAIAAFGVQSLIIAARNGGNFVGLDLTVEEWRALGFKRVAGSHFLFRDNCCKNPYTEDNPDS